MATNSRHQQFIQRTQALWHVRARRPLTEEGARQVASNAVGFFRVLGEWAALDTAQANDRAEVAHDG